ncbi:phage protease [Sphingomonas melonis]|uniref:phage protease n=1 Tax=Sphingomonas melonis TaxID=152682 RepID=UPI0035C802BD
MTRFKALCSAVPLPADTNVPDWIHLLPAGEIRTADGRGPYRVTNVQALMAASLAFGKLPLDENHAIDLAAPQGGSSPARGWIVDLQQRSDGLWGRVEWTPAGRMMMADRAYRGVSPAIQHMQDGTITAVLRASLTNNPNFTGLVSLHSKGVGPAHLTAAERDVIRHTGVDADAFIAAKPQTMTLHAAAIDAQYRLTSADRAVISRLGLDPLDYAAERQG